MESQVVRLSEESRNTLRDGERKLEEKFRAELSAQTRLANLYKSQREENSSKVDELSKIITDLRNLLEESSKKQENLIRNQNRAMIDQLQNMGQQMSDITAAVNVSLGEEPASTSDDEEDRFDETPEATGQPSLKRARVSPTPEPVIKEEECSDDEDTLNYMIYMRVLLMNSVWQHLMKPLVKILSFL